jgi:transcriptional regulator with XRE-family HTH domain
MTANQVVSYRLRQARLLRGWTQADAAERLAPYLGVRWSVAILSAVEVGARDGRRVRRFSADQLFALARGFEVPVLYFFVPPPEGRLATPDAGPDGLDSGLLFDALVGTDETWPELEAAVEGWAMTEPAAGTDGVLDCPPRLQERLSALVDRFFAARLEGTDALTKVAAVLTWLAERDSGHGIPHAGSGPHLDVP